MEQNTQLDTKLVTDVVTNLRALEPDVARRNAYMNTRDRTIYGTGLWEDLEIDGWFAEYNYLQRVIDIHTAQLMGRPFNVYSYYNKEDLTPYENDPQELELAKLRNKKAKANADARKKAIEGIRRDNGGDAIYKEGARLGSAYGMTVYKQWFDKAEMKVRRQLIESPQNLYFGWSDNNFREFDFCAYVYQISADKAYRDYGSKLAEGEMFNTSKEGTPFATNAAGSGSTTDPLNQMAVNSDDKGQQTDREMVTVIDLSGYITGYAKDGKGFKSVDRGKETRMAVLIVGGKLVQVISDEKYVPKFYYIPNRIAPRRSVPMSDIPQSAIDINKEIIQLEADQRRWAGLNLFKKFQAKGFDPTALPIFKQRKTQMVAMSPEQSIEEIGVSTAQLQEFRSLIEGKLEAFVRVTNVSRVMFDDPSISANSNQALMTTMKPIIDIVEDKQSRWETVIAEMDEDALYLSAEFIPELKEPVKDDEGWYLCVEWPSVLRKEDASYQAMWLNRFNANTISLETYMEKMGDDYSEELDRLRDEMTDPTAAAVLGRQLAMLAQNLISPPQPQQPQTKYNVNVKADATVDPNSNLDVIGEVMGAGQYDYQPAEDGSVPMPGGQITTPQENTDQTQPMSQPGTGQPAVSPEGAVAQANQNAGA